MEVKSQFATNFKELREEKGLTQQEIADALGVSRGTISFYEKAERTADIDFLVKAADFFDVSVDYLLGKAKARSVNTSVDDICEYTGLSEESVEKLHSYTKDTKPANSFDGIGKNHYLDFINFLFVSVVSETIFKSMAYYKMSSKRCLEELKEVLQECEANISANKELPVGDIGFTEILSYDAELDTYRAVKAFEKTIENYIETENKEIEKHKERIIAFLEDEINKAGDTDANNNQTE